MINVAQHKVMYLVWADVVVMGLVTLLDVFPSGILFVTFGNFSW